MGSLYEIYSYFDDTTKLNDVLLEYSTFAQNNFKDFNQTELIMDTITFMNFFGGQYDLMNPLNMANFYENYITKNLYNTFNQFKLTYLSQLQVFGDYIFDYLPKFYKRTIKVQGNENNIYEVLREQEVFISLVQNTLASTFQKLKDQIIPILISKMIFFKPQKINCLDLFSDILDDAAAKNICNNPLINFSTYDSIKLWIYIQDCIGKNCKNDAKKYLQDLSGLTEAQVQQLYSADKLEKYIQEQFDIINLKYNCKNNLCTDAELANRQWLSSEITKNPPISELLITNTINDWDRIADYDLEYNSYNEVIKDNGLDILVKARDLQAINADYFNVIDDLTTAYAYYINNDIKNDIFNKLSIKDAEYFFNSLYKLIQKINFPTVMYQQITNWFIFGNAYKSLNILKTGSYVENYQPLIKKSSGLINFFDDGSDIDMPIKYFNYKTGYDVADLDSIRMITQINNSTKHNVFKDVYSPKENLNYKLRNYLYKDQNITNLNDMFQISSNKEEIRAFDIISSKELIFLKNGLKNFNNIDCVYYSLRPFKEVVKNNLTNLTEVLVSLNEEDNKNSVYEKFNKPFVIDNIPNELAETVNGDYICVEPYTNFVISANYSLKVYILFL